MKTFHHLLPALLLASAAALRAQAPADGPLEITPKLVDDLLAEADGRNPTVLAAGARADAATAAVDSVRTWEDPVLKLGVWGSTPRGVPASQQGNIIYGIEQKLPLFGHPGLARHVAEAKAARDRLSVGSAREELRRDITLAILDIALTDRATDLAAQGLDWAETSLASVDARYRSGRSGQVEWLAAETERAEAAEQLTTLRAMRASQEEQADRLLSRERYARWPALSLPGVAGTVIYDDRIVSAALASAPRLKVLRQEAVRNEAAAHLTWHMRMPEVGLGLEARQYTGDAGFREGMMTVNLSLPWVNSGRYDSDAARDKALVRAAERDADAYANQVREDVHHACVDLDTARRRALLYRDQLIPLAEQALESSQASWESGQARFQDILEAHRALVADRLALAQATTDQRREMAGLTLLTGVADLPAAFAPNPVAGRH
jgi:outer membrane protein TolC